MFAVVEIAKKQYIIREGDILDVQKLKQDSQNISFDRVLLFADKDRVGVGEPYLEGAKVEAEVAGQKKGKKVIVYKCKKRKKYRKKQGHRQNYTTVKITGISVNSSQVGSDAKSKVVSKKDSEKPAPAKKTAVKKPAQKKTSFHPSS